MTRRVLLDECLPHDLRHHLTDFTVETVAFAGLAGLSNGALMRAAAERFDVIVTIDGGIPYQQAVSELALAVVVVRVAGNRLEDLIPHAEDIRSAIRLIGARSVIVIE